jgi:hypothetical protein
MKRPHNDKTIIIFVLIIIIAGGVATLFQLHPWAKEPIEIILPEENTPISDAAAIYIDGSVLRPGWYPIYEYSTINDVILSAGGLTEVADISEIKLYIPTEAETNASQKISIICDSLFSAVGFLGGIPIWGAALRAPARIRDARRPAVAAAFAAIDGEFCCCFHITRGYRM